MAHFAKLDENNIVTEVLVVNNDILLKSDGTESENKGKVFLNGLFGSATWVQTSYNNNFRKQYAGRGFTYDPEDDVFISIQPFPSWSLNETTHDWEAPIPFPSTTVYNEIEIGSFWDESGQVWMGKDENGNEYNWDHSNLVWIPS